MRFSGKTAIVTGGANGMGKACVEKLVAEGARVAVIDKNQDAMAELSETHGFSAHTADVMDEAQSS